MFTTIFCGEGEEREGAVTSKGTKSACTCSLNVLRVWLCLDVSPKDDCTCRFKMRIV